MFAPLSIAPRLRAIAACFAIFGLVNQLLGLVVPGFDANVWWIDLRFTGIALDWVGISGVLTQLFPPLILVWISGALLHFAMEANGLADAGRLRALSRWGLLGMVLCVSQNTIQYYGLLAAGFIRSAFPVPLSLFLLLPAVLIFLAARNPYSLSVSGKSSGGLAFLLSAMAFVIAFPLAQMVCFGSTDYRRPADMVVIFGARAYASGRMSTALFDRARTGVELYTAGLAGRLFLSGGPGDGAVHEAEAMQRYAIEQGVDQRDLILDRAGLSTQATVLNSKRELASSGYDRVLAVSQFYHLPRVKLSYIRAGVQAYTVPARKTRLIRKLPLLMLREVAAFWYYYLRPLLPGSASAEAAEQ